LTVVWGARHPKLRPCLAKRAAHCMTWGEKGRCQPSDDATTAARLGRCGARMKNRQVAYLAILRLLIGDPKGAWAGEQPASCP